MRPVAGKAPGFDRAAVPRLTLRHPRRATRNTPGETIMSSTGTPNEPVITSYAHAPTRTVTAGGVTYAYRELGPKGGVPVVFFVHLAATLDNWDPRIIDPIAKGRHVIAFDQRGVGASTGQVPDSIEAMADDAYTFITALGFDKIDIFSFSLGGMIAQALVVKHPELVRKLVLTGTGPKGGKDIDKVSRHHVLGHAARHPDPVGPQGIPVLQPRHHRQARRTRVRQPAQGTQGRPRCEDQDQSVPDAAEGDQEVGRSAPDDLSQLTQPTLIANGDNDRMVPSVLSEDLHRRIKDSELIIYPDSGHGGIFQYHQQFAPSRSSSSPVDLWRTPQLHVRRPGREEQHHEHLTVRRSAGRGEEAPHFLDPAVGAYRPAPPDRHGPLEGTALRDHLRHPGPGGVPADPPRRAQPGPVAA